MTNYQTLTQGPISPIQYIFLEVGLFKTNPERFIHCTWLTRFLYIVEFLTVLPPPPIYMREKRHFVFIEFSTLWI